MAAIFFLNGMKPQIIMNCHIINVWGTKSRFSLMEKMFWIILKYQTWKSTGKSWNH